MLALDLHANLAPETTTLANALFGFHYSPHTDMAETGARAADCLLRTLRGEVRPVAALVKPALTLPSIFTATSVAPLKDIVAEAVRYVSGMTDRFALNLAVEFLGWEPDNLPRGV